MQYERRVHVRGSTCNQWKMQGSDTTLYPIFLPVYFFEGFEAMNNNAALGFNTGTAMDGTHNYFGSGGNGNRTNGNGWMDYSPPRRQHL